MNNNVFNHIPVDKSVQSYIRDAEYQCLMGSHAYGCNNAQSDMDIYGFCIPPNNILFPYSVTTCNVLGFDKQVEKFNVYQAQKVAQIDNIADVKMDINIYNIAYYFRLVIDCNPNMIDSLFVNDEDVLFLTPIGELVRKHRLLFLSNKVYYPFSGYADAQIKNLTTKTHISYDSLLLLEKNHNIDNKTTFFTALKVMKEKGFKDEHIYKEAIQNAKENCPNPNDDAGYDTLSKLTTLQLQEYVATYASALTNCKRVAYIKYYGYDVKFAYHTIRLLYELKQLLTTANLDLKKEAESYKKIRAGKVPLNSVIDWIKSLYAECKDIFNSNKSILPDKPNEKEVKQLLMKCIELKRSQES